ncbi:MAG TPA: crosslink repair DNA glycosylase YcaQ family protein, partial [Candidatus Limnocylindrales bacterium]|nr:crosslink repair DNA glycosylase YcaQ family protein [Candidatus Limnocylindrales bacterium]
MTEPILSTRALNRALLARQLLLDRATTSIADAVEQVGGLQTQYAPSGYVGLWTRLAGFERGALTRALEERTVIQATLMRVTIHIVSRREYWLYALGVRAARREQWRRTFGRATGAGEPELAAAADRLRDALRDGPRDVKQLGDHAKGFVGTHGLWVDLVRVPPAGTWERRRADRLGLAEHWVGPPDATEEEGRIHLVRA